MPAHPEAFPALTDKAERRIAKRDQLIVQLNDAAEAIGRVDLEALGWIDHATLQMLLLKDYDCEHDLTRWPGMLQTAIEHLHRANERDLASIRRMEAESDPFRE